MQTVHVFGADQRAAQKLIAIYLRGDQRDRFTDMPPPGK
jgi:hypothetical protein